MNKEEIIKKVEEDLITNFSNIKYKKEYLNDEYNTLYFIVDKQTFMQDKFKDWRFKIKRELIWQNEDICICFDYEDSEYFETDKFQNNFWQYISQCYQTNIYENIQQQINEMVLNYIIKRNYGNEINQNIKFNGHYSFNNKKEIEITNLAA